MYCLCVFLFVLLYLYVPRGVGAACYYFSTSFVRCRFASFCLLATTHVLCSARISQNIFSVLPSTERKPNNCTGIIIYCLINPKISVMSSLNTSIALMKLSIWKFNVHSMSLCLFRSHWISHCKWFYILTRSKHESVQIISRSATMYRSEL